MVDIGGRWTHINVKLHFFFKSVLPVHPSFGMTMTQDIRDLFAYRSPNNQYIMHICSNSRFSLLKSKLCLIIMFYVICFALIYLIYLMNMMKNVHVLVVWWTMTFWCLFYSIFVLLWITQHIKVWKIANSCSEFYLNQEENESWEIMRFHFVETAGVSIWVVFSRFGGTHFNTDIRAE